MMDTFRRRQGILRPPRNITSTSTTRTTRTTTALPEPPTTPITTATKRITAPTLFSMIRVTNQLGELICQITPSAPLVSNQGIVSGTHSSSATGSTGGGQGTNECLLLAKFEFSGTASTTSLDT